MHSGSSLTSENPDFSISIGIAALIIEGRPLYDDEYATDSADNIQRRQSAHNFPSSALKCRYRSPETSQSLLGMLFGKLCNFLLFHIDNYLIYFVVPLSHYTHTFTRSSTHSPLLQTIN